MTYQVCPICLGSGINQHPPSFSDTLSCTKCAGEGIIHTETALPSIQHTALIKAKRNKEIEAAINFINDDNFGGF